MRATDQHVVRVLFRMVKPVPFTSQRRIIFLDAEVCPVPTPDIASMRGQLRRKERDHYAPVNFQFSYRILASVAVAIPTVVVGSTVAQSLVSQFESESNTSASVDLDLPMESSEPLQFLEENFAVEIDAPASAQRDSEARSGGYDTIQFLEDNWLLGTATIEEVIESDEHSTLRHDMIRFLEDIWPVDSRTLNVAHRLDD